jgi:N-methylhydantoinase B
VKLLEAMIRKWGRESSRPPINYNIEHTEKRFREEVAKWPDGLYEAERVHRSRHAGHQGCEGARHLHRQGRPADRRSDGHRRLVPKLVGVWNTFANSRGYVMTQIAAAIDPTIVKNEGLFNAVEIIIPENTIAQPPHQQAGSTRLLPSRLRNHRGGLRGAVAGRAGTLGAAGL